MDLGFDLSKIEGFDWDNGNIEHIKNHKVLYTECEEIFSHKPLIINKDETHSQLEDRFRAFGQTSLGRRLVVIFTLRENEQSSTTYKIRVVSARDQNKKERKECEEVGGEEL